jgi:hypothetical protein
MVVVHFAVFVLIPRKLDTAKSIELIDRLLKYDTYLGRYARIDQNDRHDRNALPGSRPTLG